MKNKIVIGLIGEIASGKGTAAKYLVKKHGFELVLYSALLKDILKRIYLEENRDNLVALSYHLRKAFGEDIFERVIINDIGKSRSRYIVLDGIRRESDIKNLSARYKFKTIFIDAGMEVRYRRLGGRNERTDDKKPFEEFKKDHKKETEKAIRRIGARADYIIDNSSGLKHLYGQIDRVVEKVKKS